MRILAVPKTLALAAIYLVLTKLLHYVFRFGANSIEGIPRVPLLVLMSTLVIGLLVVAFNKVQDLLPVRGSFGKGIAFTVFFFLSVLVPSILGMIAFESDAEWQWLTPKKIGTYLTLVVDVVVYLVVGGVMGLLFPSGKSRRLPAVRRLALAASACGIVFPLAMWGAMSTVLPLLGVAGPLGRSLWFTLTFYGPFLLTGICLPLLHLVTGQSRPGRARGVLATTFVFALLWLPFQNFMVAFGWSFLPGFVFSLVSMVPVALTIALADALMGRGGSQPASSPAP